MWIELVLGDLFRAESAKGLGCDFLPRGGPATVFIESFIRIQSGGDVSHRSPALHELFMTQLVNGRSLT